MIARLALYLLVALGGAALTLQIAWNSRLREATGSPLLATLISAVITLIVLTAAWLGGNADRGTVPAFASVPLWGWLGGVLAAFYLIVALAALPRLGAAAVFALVIAGQMFAALVVDSTGAFGVPQLPLNASRVIGAVLLLAGVVAIQRA